MLTVSDQNADLKRGLADSVCISVPVYHHHCRIFNNDWSVTGVLVLYVHSMSIFLKLII